MVLAGVALFFAFTSDAGESAGGTLTPRNCAALANGNSGRLRECSEVNNLAILGMRPNLPHRKKVLLHQLERSARAELKLRKKALKHAQEQNA